VENTVKKPGNTSGLKPPWKKGCPSPNPGGRPKKNPISDRYAEVAETPVPERVRKIMKLRRGATHGDAIAFSQARAAIKGRTDAAREFREAIEGKAAQRLQISGPGEGQVRIDVAGLAEALKLIYGLRSPAEPSADAARPISLSGQVDPG
jgi:hypothetical protein